MPPRGPSKESVLTAGIVVWAVALQLIVFLSSGPLWRDEAWSAAQAGLRGWSALWESLQWDTFPILYPAFLRLLREVGLTGTDFSLRAVGLLTSLIFIAVLVMAARTAGRAAPAFVVLLAAANPVLARESAAVRPYGLALLGVLVTWICMARCLVRASVAHVFSASVAAVFAVQVSYGSAAPVAAICVAAAATAGVSRDRRTAMALLIPAGAAALSLLPYTGIVTAAREWTVLLHTDPDWPSFLRRSTSAYDWVLALLWLAVLVVSWRPVRSPGAFSALPMFALWAAAICLAIQVVLIQLAGIPLFSRYFLPILLTGGLALGFRLAQMSFKARAAILVLGAVATATPTLDFLRQRRTNADLVAGYLNRASGGSDLVLISPWFLHPSFARYYSGNSDWCAVPDVGHGPGVRYDEVRALMTGGAPDADVGVRIAEALDRGGTVWLVSQRYPSTNRPPRRPAPVTPEGLNGSRYSEFRSYWERNVESRLLQLAVGKEIWLGDERNVWREERLVLSRWRRQ